MSSHGSNPLARIPMGALLLLATWLCAAAPAWAQSSDDQKAMEAARPLFDEGRALMEQGQYAAAAEKLEAAYRIYPGVGTLLNLGVCRRENGEPAAAWEIFRSAAELAKSTGDNREAYARERMNELARELSFLTIEVPEQARASDLSVTRNGEPVSEERWGAPMPVPPGTYLVRAERPGAEPFEARVDVSAKGSSAEVAIPELKLLDPSAPPPRPELLPEPSGPVARDSGMTMGRKIALGSFAVGAIGLIGGGVLGLRAGSQYDDAESICSVDDVATCSPAQRAESQELRTEARSTADLATISVAVGAAAAAAGVVLWLVSAPDEPADGTAWLTPMLGPQVAGVSLGFGF